MYPEFYNLGTLFVWGIPIQVIYAAVIVAFTVYLLNRTRMGRHIYAVGGNRKRPALPASTTARSSSSPTATPACWRASAGGAGSAHVLRPAHSR